VHIDKYKATSDSLDLLTRGDIHSKYTPSEVISYILLPINHNRIRLYYVDDKPVGLITWCWFSPDKANLFLEDRYTPTSKDYEQENPGEDYQLWCIDLIAPYGHARKMVRTVRNEHKELYGTTTKVHFRRFYNRQKLHRRTF
jgi:hemolysin-activating ACP:hemolysin acyltransferase